MSKPVLVLCLIAGTIGVAAGAIAQQPRDRLTRISIIAPLPPDSPALPSGASGRYPAHVLAPEPHPLSPQAEVSLPPPRAFGPVSRAVAEKYESVSQPCHQGDCHEGPCDGTCAGHPIPWRYRLEAWWGVRKARLQESHWGYPEEFCEPLLGARLYAHWDRQIANGLAAQMVLYRYDFYEGILDDASKLNHHGRKRLQDMVRMLESNVYPIIVEETPDEPQLASTRRDHVLKALEELGSAAPEEWVAVGAPKPIGLSGDEAIVVHQQMLQGARLSVKTEETTGLLFTSKTTEEPADR